jgi:hypothetical protein
LAATIEAIVVERPEPTEESPRTYAWIRPMIISLDIRWVLPMDIRGISAGLVRRSWMSWGRKGILPDGR